MSRAGRLSYVHLVWRLAVKRPVRSGLVAERQVALHALVRSADRLIGVKIDLLVCDALPESFNKHVVPPTSFPVHADLHAVVCQEPRELQAGELAPLIGSEDLGWVLAAHGALNRIEPEIGRQRVGQPPRQHSTTRPVEETEISRSRKR